MRNRSSCKKCEVRLPPTLRVVEVKFKQLKISEKETVEYDEIWTFVQKKQKTLIWLCISKIIKKILAVYIGDRGEESTKKLIAQIPHTKHYYTDNCDTYNYVIDIEQRTISKKYTHFGYMTKLFIIAFSLNKFLQLPSDYYWLLF